MPIQNCAVTDFARKHQPRRLSEKFGGLDVAANRFFANAIATGRLPRLLVITGPAGSGKGTTARIIGRRHCCDSKDQHPYEPCLECPGCKSIDDSSGSVRWTDYGYVEFDATRHSGEQIVTWLEKESIYYAIENGNTYMFVIDELARNRQGIQERLLRLIENIDVSIILITINPGDILTPLFDRCAHIALKPPTRDQVVSGLTRIAECEGYKLIAAAGETIARLNGNIPRTSVQALGLALTVADSTVIDEVVVTAAFDMMGVNTQR